MFLKTKAQIHFVIPGAPVAKGRPKFRRVGTYVQTYTPSKTLKAERYIQDVFKKRFIVRTDKLSFPIQPLSNSSTGGDIYTSAADNGTIVHIGGRITPKTDMEKGLSFGDSTRCGLEENCSAIAARGLQRGQSEKAGRNGNNNALRLGELKREAVQAGIWLRIDFYCPIPTSLSKKRKKWLEGRFCLKKPDLDNYVKLVCDALNGLAWEDDNAVAGITAVKIYSSEPRTEVNIYYLEEGLDKCDNVCYTNNIPKKV